MLDKEKAAILDKMSQGEDINLDSVNGIIASVLDKPFVPIKEVDNVMKLQKNLKEGGLVIPGVNEDAIDQILTLQKLLESQGKDASEVTNLLAKATSSGLSDETISSIMSKALNDPNISSAEVDKLMKLQKSLKDGSLKFGNKPEDCIAKLFKSGALNPETLAQALLAQKVLNQSGLTPEDLAKAAMLQQMLSDSGASKEAIAEAMKRTVFDSGISLEEMMKDVANSLKQSGSNIDPNDVAKIVDFQKALGATSAARIALGKLKPEHLNLLDEVARNRKPGEKSTLEVLKFRYVLISILLSGDVKAIIRAMKEALGDALDDTTIEAMEVAACMEKAGADKEEIEEMMAMIMNKDGGVSQEFLNNLKAAMDAKGNQIINSLARIDAIMCVYLLVDPEETLRLLRNAVDEEMNSVTNCLRNTFLNKIPTEEEISKTCQTLAEKLSGNATSKNDAKLALMDVIEEALHGTKTASFIQLRVLIFLF